MRRRAKRKSAAPSHERWLLSYADFVTLLLAVFIVLFATTWRHQQSFKTVSTAIHKGFEALSVDPPPPPTEKPSPPPKNTFDTSDITAQLQAVLGDAIKRQEIVLQKTPDGLVISLRELGFFNSGTAILLPGAAEKLKRTAEVLIRNGVDVRVEGHSDDQPIHTALYQSNWELSTARATNVLTLLLQDSFPETKVSVAGYGPYRPVADNATQEGRRQNRRVDLVVLMPHDH